MLSTRGDALCAPWGHEAMCSTQHPRSTEHPGRAWVPARSHPDPQTVTQLQHPENTQTKSHAEKHTPTPLPKITHTARRGDAERRDTKAPLLPGY